MISLAGDYLLVCCLPVGGGSVQCVRAYVVLNYIEWLDKKINIHPRKNLYQVVVLVLVVYRYWYQYQYRYQYQYQYQYQYSVDVVDKGQRWGRRQNLMVF